MTRPNLPIRTERWFEGRALLLLSAPAVPGPVSQTVLVVLPPGPEQARTYRLLRELAANLAANGIPVLRLALSGTGHTAAHSQETELPHWHRDISNAARTLRELWPSAMLSGLGIRFGARLLLDALPAPDRLAALVAWSPILRGGDWVRHLQAVEAQMQDAGQHLDSADLAGVSWSAGLLAEVNAQDTPEYLPEHTTFVLDADSSLAPTGQFQQIVSEFDSSDWRSPNLPMIVAGDISRTLCDLLLDTAPSADQIKVYSPNNYRTQLTVHSANLSVEEPFSLGGMTAVSEQTAGDDTAPEQGLFGIYRSGHAACPVVVMLNSGMLACEGPFGLYGEIANNLAHQGIASVRFDFSGKGESPRKSLSSDRAIFDDYAQISDFLRQRGHQQVVLLGICSGADDALVLGQQADNVAGLVLLDGYAPKTLGYTRHYVQERLTDPARIWAWLVRLANGLVGAQPQPADAAGRRTVDTIELRDWASPADMQSRYQTVLGRSCPTLALFTGAFQHDYYNHEGQLSDALGQPAQLTERYYPEMDHLYPASSQRAELMQQISDWAIHTFDLHAVRQT